MRHRPSTYFILFLLFLPSFQAGLLAQNETPVVSATVRILLQRHIPPVRFQQGEEIPPEYRSQSKEYYYLTPEGYQPLVLESNKVSQSIHYQGPPEFILYKRILTETPEDEDTYRPQLGCLLPLGFGQDIFLIGQESLTDEKRQLAVIAVAPDQIPLGSIYAYNLGGRPLQVASGKQRLSLRPNQGALLTSPIGGTTQFQVLAAITDDNSYKLVYRRHWPALNTQRSLCVFFPTDNEMTRWSSRIISVD